MTACDAGAQLSKRWRCLLSLLAIGWMGFVPGVCGDEASDRLTLAVDALTRLEGVDLSTNPALKERILVILEKTRGTPNFVRLVRHFKLPGQEAGLLAAAAAQPREETGIDALRLVLTSGHSDDVKPWLATNDAKAIALTEALGNTGHRDSVPLLLPLLKSQQASAELKKAAVKSLVKTADGAKDLLSLAKDEKLSPELKTLAVSELSQVHWENIRTEARSLQGQSIVTLPPIAELLKMRGDPASGQKVFQRASPGCVQCHVVSGQGTELGPNLTEIGSKLAKEALYQAILEPSAGISFGYEAFTLTLKDGDEAYGLIVSETPDEITLKAIGGVVTRHKKSNVASRQKSALSIMPAGLEAGMTVQELVDLVEYLTTLKKAN